MAEMIIISRGVVSSDIYLNQNGSMIILDGGLATETTATYAYLYISSGGSAVNTYLKKYGRMWVSSGGIVENTIISGENAAVFISSGAEANGISAVQYGNLTLYEGAIANNIIIDSRGATLVNSGGVASGIAVTSGGWLTIASGGTALDVNGTPFESVSIANGAYVTFTSDYSGVFWGSDAQLFSQAQTMVAKTISSCQSMIVLHDGVAENIKVNSAGSYTVSSGGIVNSTTINNGGLGILLGGIANNTVVSGWQAYLILSNGGTANETTLKGAGQMKISSGGIANNTTQNAGAIGVYGGGIANYTSIVSQGGLTVYDNGIVNNTTLDSKSNLDVAGGIANSTTIRTASYLRVYNDGTTFDTTISDYGYLTVSDGTASNTTIDNYGSMYLSSGCFAEKTTINRGGIFHLSSGGTAEETTVNSGGWFYVSSGGTASNTMINSGGNLHISSGGKITGTVSIENGASLSAYYDSVLDFDLTRVSPENTPLVKNLSLISGMLNYVVTVAGNEQTFGVYLLADGIDSFSNSISVQNEFGTIGSLSLGKRTRLKEIDYKLTLMENTLSLLIDEADLVSPTVNNISASITTPTNQDVVITAEYSDDVALEYSLYKLGENGSWLSYSDGITVSANTTVFFKAIDESGNVSEVLSYEVTNIDKMAPEKPAVSADITVPTNQDVIVSAVFSDDSEIKEYSFNGDEWLTYTYALRFEDNGSVSFRAIDAAGNISEITKYTVSNIDKIAPIKPTASASITTPTRLDVTVTVEFSNDSVLQEYSLDGNVWSNYKDAIVFSKNGTAFFRGTDEAGNASEITSCVITNIDKTPPIKPIATADIMTTTHGKVNVAAIFSDDTIIREYSIDGTNWLAYIGAIQFSDNGTVFFRGTDHVGNVSEIERFDVTNIVKIIPQKPVVSAERDTEKNQAIVRASFDDNSTVKEYSFDGETWKNYERPIVLYENATLYFRSTNEYDNVSEIVSHTVSGLRITTVISNGEICDGVITKPVFVLNGGMASNTIVGYDIMRVLSGGIASNTVVNPSKVFTVEEGGVAYHSILSGGTLHISSGGTVYDTIMSTITSQTPHLLHVSQAKLTVFNGGSVNSAFVDSGSILAISSGGTATNINAESGSYIYLALASDTCVEGLYNGSSFKVDNGLFSSYTNTTPASYFSWYLSSSGMSTIVSEECSAFVIDIYANGVADSVNGCNYNVYSGGIANNIRTGCLNIYSGGIANNINECYLNIYSGGNADNISGCNVFVASGGTATIIDSPFAVPAVSFESGACVSFCFTSQVSGVHYYYRTNYVGSETVATSAAVVDFLNSSTYVQDSKFNSLLYSSGLYVMSGGTALNAGSFPVINVIGGVLKDISSFNWGGDSLIQVFSGGTANNVTLFGFNEIDDSARVMSIVSGGTANNTTISACGILNIQFGGVANDTILNSRGRLYVSAGGIANRTIVNSLGGSGYNGIASFVISSGGVANDTIVSSGGTMYVASGGTANNVIWTPCVGTIGMEAGAHVTFASQLSGVYNGDQDYLLIHSMLIESRALSGSTFVFAGGTVNDASLSSMFVFSGGVANRTNADSTFVYSGGIINSTSVGQRGHLLIYSDGTAQKTFLSGGWMYVCEGGVTNNTSIKYGSMYVSSGGTANNTTISSGGLIISSGGTATGMLTINSSSFVSACEGATINYDLTQTTINSEALINVLSRIKGTPFYTLTTDGKQADGIYKLAGGATYFDNAITVVNTFGAKLGTLNIGSSLLIGKTEYLLNLFSDELLLTITTKGTADIIKPTVTNIKVDITVPTNKSVTVTADFKDDIAIASKLYKLGSGSTWLAYTNGVTVSQNATIYFKAVDTSGNESEEASYIVSNIDKTPPVKPIASASVSTPTNGSVTVTATYSDDSSVKEYSLNGQTWIAYTEPILLDKNGLVFFRGTDAVGNISEVEAFTVNNIDTTAPEKPTASANITTPTNQAVTVTAAFSGDTDKKEYSLDEQTWLAYGNGVTMPGNGTVYFRGTDEAGNVSEIASYEVTNIDTTQPDKPVASAAVTGITKDDVFVTATFSEDSVTKDYSFDGENWSSYTEAIKLSVNGTVYFRGIDEAGNISEVTSVVVDNIDKNAPKKPVAIADITTPTNKAVLVSASFSDDSLTQEYSLDGSVWQVYTNAIEFTQNGSVSFRGTDEAGNESEIETYIVSNIDITAPDKPVVSADITKETNTDVTVSAVFSTDSVIKEYSLDGDNWLPYTDGVAVSDNCTVSFRGADEAGNVSEIATYTVSNIDTTAPDTPVASADITEMTNTDVMVSAVFSDDSVLKEYSLDGTTWRAYTAPIPFSQNGVVYFRGSDVAGNTSELETYTVGNIDKVAPDKPVATADIMTPTNGVVCVSAIFNDKSVFNEYSMNGTDWTDYTGSVEFTSNGVVYFRSTDAIGNVSEVTSYEVCNIDTVAPEKPTASADITTATVQDVTVTAVFSNDSVVREYTLDGQTWKPYTEPIAFTANGSVSFRGKDEAGNVSEEVSYVVGNIFKAPTEKPVASADITTPTNQTVTVSAVFDSNSVKNEYSTNGLVWLTYVDGVRMLDNGVVYFRSTNAVGNVSEIEAYTVDCIDKVAPDKPFIFASNTKLTNQDVTVTAVYSEDSAVKEYSTDGQTWLPYTEPLKVSENGMFLFRAKDEAGNSSGMINFEVGNIDKDAPVITLSGDTQTPTEQVMLMATVDDGSTLFYRIGNSDWVVYTGVITVSANATYSFKATDAAGNTGTSEIVFRNIQSAVVMPENLVGTQDKVSWNSTGAEQYIVEYSTDNFEHVIQVVTSAPATDLLDLPAGAYQWRVKTDDVNGDWAVGEAFEAKAEIDDRPKVVQSNEDGNDDLFFASANGTWENIYYAQNVGSINDWTGTNEIISANGKGRIQNLFFGSTDPNVLCLTDGENGDAIFVDDVYTELPESVAEHTARLYKIQEVRAGAGDDIVDMTSQRFEYVGDGLTIRGGEGNDTIWATKGNNFLFGDAGDDRIIGASGSDVIAGGIGNDRMHGGGGEDIFTFCDNWGEDTVEQLAGGKVTLWFASGDESKWNPDTLTYTDGDNSVTVKRDVSVELKFGGIGDDAAMFATLSEAGAFKEFTSQKIFEESKGILV